MKAHEMAKKLGINMKALQELLGLDSVRSPNQELSESQLKTLTPDNTTLFPASKTFEEPVVITITSVAVDKQTKTTYCIKQRLEDGVVVSSEIIDIKKFPSLAQAFANIDYMMGKIEMGDL